MDSIPSKSQHSFCLESCDTYGLFNFSHNKTPNLVVWLNKEGKFIVAES